PGKYFPAQACFHRKPGRSHCTGCERHTRKRSQRNRLRFSSEPTAAGGLSRIPACISVSWAGLESLLYGEAPDLGTTLVGEPARPDPPNYLLRISSQAAAADLAAAHCPCNFCRSLRFRGKCCRRLPACGRGPSARL